jgi:2-polyprenyl-6-methoxyphenol hydroxylase-like FAD-dependent oxidoreductase
LGNGTKPQAPTQRPPAKSEPDYRPRRRCCRRIPAIKSDTVGPTAELEIFRGDLARILVEAGRDRTEYIFGDRINALDDIGPAVVARFEKAIERRFGLVVAADGMGSTTRDLVFGGMAVQPIGLDLTYLTIPALRPTRTGGTGTSNLAAWVSLFDPTGTAPLALSCGRLFFAPPAVPAFRTGLRTNRRHTFANNFAESVGKPHAYSRRSTARTTCTTSQSARFGPQLVAWPHRIDRRRRLVPVPG